MRGHTTSSPLPLWERVPSREAARRVRGLLGKDSFEANPSPGSLFEHDLFRKPVPTFRDHALLACARNFATLSHKGRGGAVAGRGKGRKNARAALSSHPAAAAAVL